MGDDGATTQTEPTAGRSSEKAGRWLLAVVGVLLGLIVAPIVLRGGLLADDYVICIRPVHLGYGHYLETIWRDTGVVRPARFLELLLISKACHAVPFGLAIAAPLTLKVVSAFLLHGLLRDLPLRAPWPAIGTALWLLEPVGTEAALWPSALHVLLGVCLALAALRLFHRGALVWGGIATLLAALSVEQVLFALPFAVWLVTPQGHRRRATTVAGAVTFVVILAYATWPGDNPRQAVSLADRIGNAATKSEWYLLFPAANTGLYSGALAFLWAFPLGIAAVGAGAVAGAWSGPSFVAEPPIGPPGRRAVARGLAVTAGLLILVNVPLIVTEVGYSARTFTPTWLVLSAVAAIGGARVVWRRPRVIGFAAGTFVALALLSIALSVSVRLRTDAFDRAAARWIADRTRDGDVVAVCDVGRTVVEPAPLGSFHLHELHATSGEWIEYLTGRIVDVRRSGERYWGSRCPKLKGADLVISFPELVDAVDGA